MHPSPRLLARHLRRWLAALVVVVPLTLAGFCGGGGGGAPKHNVEDGTEVDGAVWQPDGFSFRNRLGWRAGQPHDLGLRFKVPELVQGQQVAYARLVLPATGDGVVGGPLPLEIVGLDADWVDAFTVLRPSQYATVPTVVSWEIAQNWPGFTQGQAYTCVPLRRMSPDVSALVNEILARPGWGTGGADRRLGLVVRDANPPETLGDNYVTTQDTKGFGSCANDHSAKLEIYPTLWDTFLGGPILGRVEDRSVTANAWSLVPVDAYFEWGTAPGVYTVATTVLSYAAETPIELVLGGLAPDTRYWYRMRYRRAGGGVFEAGPEGSFQTQRPPGSGFTFAVLADSHLQNRFMDGDAEGLALYQQALANVVADAPDFVLDLGDTFHTEFVQGRNAADAAEALQRYLDQRPYLSAVARSSPLFLVLGNHEGELGWELDGTPDNLSIWSATARLLAYPNPQPDAFYSTPGQLEPLVGERESQYAFQWGDVLIVAIDPFWYTQEKPHDVGGPATGDRWDWTLGQAQYEWLVQTLAQSPARFKLVFAHHVTGGVTPYGRGGIKAATHALGGVGSYEWGGEDVDGSYVFDAQRPGWGLPIHALMAAQDVAIFFHGHDHVFVREDLDHVVYQAVPQPSNAAYNKGFPENTDNYAGVLVNNSGHLRVSVLPTRVELEYVRAFLDGDGANGNVAWQYAITDCNQNGVMDGEEGYVCACQDGADNDADGGVDLADPGCTEALDASEQEAALVCDDGLDNDGDALVDAADPGCAGPTDPSEQSATSCDDGLDNDADALVDAADPGCDSPADASEQSPGLACDDGADNDADALVDLADPGCAAPADVSEQSPTLVCDDGADNDGDVLVDLADPGCATPLDASEQDAGLDCDDGVDNDADALVDLADPGCSGPTDASERSPTLVCDDGADNDGDGLADAADPGCDAPADASEQSPSLACDDGADNDADALVDLADPGCAAAADASEQSPQLVCDDGTDNDGDGLADLADPDCSAPTDPSEASLLFVPDALQHAVFSYAPDGSFVGSFPLDGANLDPRGLAVVGSSLYVLDGQDQRIYRYAEAGSFQSVSRRLVDEGAGALSSPSGLAADGDDLWLVEGASQGAQLYRYSLAAAFSGAAADLLPAQKRGLDSGNDHAAGLAIDATYLYVLDASGDCFFRYARDGSGSVVESRALRRKTNGSWLGEPSGATKQGDSLWIVDAGFDEALRYLPSAIFAGNGAAVRAEQSFGLASGNGSAQGL